jgi:DNA invertase Pin-like site-specific DNA recombinase
MIGSMNRPVHPLAGQRVGYARISSASQNFDGQTDALRAAGCEKIFSDTASGKLTDRPELGLCLGYLRAGDTLVVWRLDRLGRSLRHLVETVNALAERGVGFASLHEGIDTTTSTGRLIFHIFAALAEFERELIAERAAVGRQAARTRGRLGGRPAKLSPAQIGLARARYAAGEVTVAEIATALGVGRGTIYRALREAP